MKYIIIGFIIIISINWQLLQANSAKRNQSPYIQVYGKVHGLKGSMVLNIQDTYLTLSALDRFSLLVQATKEYKLTMQVVDKPKNQQCKIIESKQKKHTVFLNIYCKIVTNISFKKSISTEETIG